MSIRVYDHYRHVLGWEWPNFGPSELACSHCGSLKVDTEALDKLQAAREEFGLPVTVHSAYRCPQHPIEKKKQAPGAHATGSAFDAKPSHPSADYFRDWFRCLAHQGLHRFGFAPSVFTDGTGQFHVDWDMQRGPAIWYY